MKKYIKKSLLLSGLSLLFSTSVLAQIPRLPANPFKGPTGCNLDKAIKTLKAKYSSTPNPLSDSFDPWPYMWGIWTQRDRGLYFELTKESVWYSNMYKAKVRVYTLCGDKLWAEGSRMLVDEDFDRTGLFMHLTGQGLKNGVPLVLMRTLPSRGVGGAVNQMSVSFLGRDEVSGEVKITDSFVTTRLTSRSSIDGQGKTK